MKLLLDGQQRITSLYDIIRGKPPKFFDGNAQAFTGLYVDLETETFEFYAPVKMKDNPLWIDVTELMQLGTGNGDRLAKRTRVGGVIGAENGPTAASSGCWTDFGPGCGAKDAHGGRLRTNQAGLSRRSQHSGDRPAVS